MKKLALILSVVFLGGMTSFGQQIPLGNLYTSNKYLINPAFAGQNTCSEIYVAHRRQWVGVANSPITSYLSGSTYLGRNVGLGLKVYTDKTDVLSQTYGMLSFAYHIRMGEQSNLSFGLSAGMFRNSLNVNNIVAIDQTDNLLTGGRYSPTFETDFGVVLKANRLTLGASVPRFIETRTVSVSTLDQGVYALRRHGLFYGSFDIPVGQNNKLVPSVMTRWAPGVDFQYDINMDFEAVDKYSFGLGYRENEGILARLGFVISDALRFNYAYEFFPTGITSRSNGSHEIQLGLKLCKQVEKAEEPKEEPITLTIKGDEGAKNYTFKTLQEMREFANKMDSEDPILADKIRQALDADGDLKDYHVDNTSIKLHIKTDEGEKDYKFRTLQQVNDFIAKTEKEDPKLAAKIRSMIDQDPSLKVYKVLDVTEEKSEDTPSTTVTEPKTTDPQPKVKDVLTKEEYELLERVVYFGLDYSTALRESEPVLDDAVRILKKHPGLLLEIDGYTCNEGNAAYNENLSYQRAKYVEAYFLRKGIPSKQIITKGYGEANPLVPNTTDENKKKNRRVEFKVVEVK